MAGYTLERIECYRGPGFLAVVQLLNRPFPTPSFWEGVGEEPNRMTARSLVLYNLFNTLCDTLSHTVCSVHRLNMKLDLQSLFDLHVQCTAVLIG